MTQVLGWVATILFTICYIPQVRKIIKTGTVDGVSALFFGIQLAANGVALDYAVRIGQTPLEIKYILGLMFVGLVLWAYYKVK